MAKKSATALHSQIKLEGELTIFTARDTADMLLASLPTSAGMEVDLSAVTEVDSAGLQVMVAAKRFASQLEKPLRFTGHSPAVLDILDLTDLVGFFGDPVVIGKGARS